MISISICVTQHLRHTTTSDVADLPSLFRAGHSAGYHAINRLDIDDMTHNMIESALNDVESRYAKNMSAWRGDVMTDSEWSRYMSRDHSSRPAAYLFERATEENLASWIDELRAECADSSEIALLESALADVRAGQQRLVACDDDGFWIE